jgi:ectoine hydroxylase-related dioxygenase (phytanoyl-CoA dioxygenase family)
MPSLAAFADEKIAEDQVVRFEEDGAVILRGVISPDWIERMQTAVDEILARPGAFASEMAPGESGRFYGDFFLWRSHPAFRAFLFESPLAELAQRMMRARSARFFYEQLLVKEPATAKPTPWHQDLPYWPLAGWQICSIWVPFDRATPETGVVTYVKGSHLWGKLYQPKPFGPVRPGAELGDEGLEEAPDIDARPQDFQFVTGVLEPGDVFVHHARTLHGAPGNASAVSRRRALATRWLGEDARWEDRPRHFLKGDKFSSLRPLLPVRSGDPLEGELFPLVTPRQTPRSRAAE